MMNDSWRDTLVSEGLHSSLGAYKIHPQLTQPSSHWTSTVSAAPAALPAALHEGVLLCVQDIIAHMATSTSGFFQGQEYHLDLVRLGTVNYLFGNQSSSSAARWLTRITGIKQVQAFKGSF